MEELKYIQLPGVIKNDEIAINQRKGHLKCNISAFKYIDIDTKQHVIYLPSLEISGYGETHEKAQELLDFSVKEFFAYLISLPTKKVQAELSKLGWLNKPLFKKEFSKAYVDIYGELKNFNAVENTIERLTLEAA